MNIPGTVALVTGAGRGIGASIVDSLLAAGASRVYAAMRTPTASSNPRVVPLALDVTDPAQIASAVERCTDVEILVNNAGVSSLQPLLAAADPDGAAREMQVNYFGTLHMCRAFAPVLASHGGGAIVNVLSILARVPVPEVGSYSASKAAALSMTQAIRAELARQRTLVIGVMPGFVDTDMARRVPFPKLAPRAVADTIVEALERGSEDVYPGPAADVERGLRHDPKAMERQFATLMSGAGGRA